MYEVSGQEDEDKMGQEDDRVRGLFNVVEAICDEAKKGCRQLGLHCVESGAQKVIMLELGEEEKLMNVISR